MTPVGARALRRASMMLGAAALCGAAPVRSALAPPLRVVLPRIATSQLGVRLRVQPSCTVEASDTARSDGSVEISCREMARALPDLQPPDDHDDHRRVEPVSLNGAVPHDILPARGGRQRLGVEF